MRRRYFARIRTWFAVLNSAAAVALGAFIGFVIATQLAPATPETPGALVADGLVRRLDFAGGIASASPTGEAIFVKAATGAALYDMDGQVLARYEGFVASFAWLGDGSGILLRAPEGGLRGTPLTSLPLVVLELDGGVTRLPVDVPEAALETAFPSPDGRLLAIVGDAVVVTDRDGRDLHAIAERAALLGWDGAGRILVATSDTIATISVDGAREEIALPAALRGAPLARIRGTEPGAVALRASDAVWRLADGALTSLPGCAPLAVTAREVLCAEADGRAFGLDVRSGSRRRLATTLERSVRAGLRAASEGVVIWIDRDGTFHLLDVETGVDRVLPDLPAEERFEPLPGARFLANDLHNTYLILGRTR